jgi:membrane protease YdiL (CAAX protease family)
MVTHPAGPAAGPLDVVRRHPILVFVVLAYALSWWPWLWYRTDPQAVDAPILPVGPLLAALILLPVIGGWPAVRDLFRRIGRWRVGLRWYALALLLPVVLTLSAVGINLLLGATVVAAFERPGLAELTVRFVFILVWIGLGEEPGWRGFALPRLLVGRSALAAALILGLIHAVWHLPLYGVEYDSADVLPWAISVFCFSIVICWVVLRTGGSVLMAILMHASNNTVALVWRMFEGGDQLRLWWVWCVLWVATAAAVVLARGVDLGRADDRTL